MKSIGFKLVGVAAFCCALFAQGAVTWQTVASGTTKTITCGSSASSSASNPNQGGGEGFNLCCDGGVTVALADGTSGA